MIDLKLILSSELGYRVGVKNPIKIGVSQCLLGIDVRYDGRNKRNSFLVNVLKNVVSFVSVCPEVEAGLSVPREPMDLVVKDNDLRLIGKESKTDYTKKVSEFSLLKVSQLREEKISGYIFKKGSPSCGLSASGPGLFSSRIQSSFPNMPVIEESDLNDIEKRDHFLAAVREYSKLL